MGKIKKNKLSRAIFLMEKAVQMFPKDLSIYSQRQLLQVIKKTTISQFSMFCKIKT